MESQDLGKASQPAYRAGSPPYKQALRKGALQSATVLLVIATTKIREIRMAKLLEGSQNVGNLLNPVFQNNLST